MQPIARRRRSAASASCSADPPARVPTITSDRAAISPLLAAEDLRQPQLVAVKAGHDLQRAAARCPCRAKDLMHQRLLVGHEGPGRRRARRGDVGDLQPLGRQRLGDRRPQVVVVEVEHRDRPFGHHPRRQIVRRIDPRRRQWPGRQLVRPAQMRQPARPGGDHHMIRPEVAHILGRQLAFRIKRHIRHLAATAPAGSPPPGTTAAAPAAPLSHTQPPAELAPRFGQRHLHTPAAPASAPPPAPPARRRPPAPDPRHPASRSSGCQPRRHSSPAVGFCVQRTQHPVMPARNADVAADAFADVSPRALRRSSSAGTDRRSTAAPPPMKSSTPRRIIATIVSGEVKRPTPTTGLSVTRFHEIDHRLMAALGREARGRAVGRGIVHLHVEQVRRILQIARSPHAPRSAPPPTAAPAIPASTCAAPRRSAHASLRAPRRSAPRTSRTRLRTDPP